MIRWSIENWPWIASGGGTILAILAILGAIFRHEIVSFIYDQD